MEKVEGIVLRSLVYREKERIITVFSKEFGLISLIVKKISGKSYNLLALTTPLTCGEFIFTKGNSDLYRFEDGALIEEHLFLREKWQFLETAGTLTQAILRSQLFASPSPLLYALFISYLKQIPFFSDPAPLIASFYLKLLKHEGTLRETPFSHLLDIRSFNELKKQKISPSDLEKIILLGAEAGSG